MPYNGTVPAAASIPPTKRIVEPPQAIGRIAERAALELVPEKEGDAAELVNLAPAKTERVDLVPEPGKGGRIVPYRKRDAKVEGKVLEYIAKGMPVERAAVAAGISHRSISRWKQIYQPFLDECRRAEAIAESILMDYAKSPNGQGARWLLSCRFGYNPVSKVETSGPNGGPVKQLTIVQHLMGKLSGQVDQL